MNRRNVHAAVILAGAACLSAAAAVTVSETKVDGQLALVLENEYIRLAVQPGKGGQCTDFVYKPTGKRFVMPRTGTLVGNRVWNYMDSDLYMQWQKRGWEHEAQRRDGEVAVTMRAAGEVNFTRSTHFEKKVVLRDGEAMARVTHTFHVGDELMQSFPIGLWFANMTGVVGETSFYTFPLDDGIMTLDLATAAGQQWLYNPTRGWAAVVGESGSGLCFNMEFRRMMCFYIWPGKQSTVEWAFRTSEIKNGGSLSTEQLLVPFAGIKQVHGSGGGVVGGIVAPDACTLEEAKQGLTLQAHLTSGTPLKGEFSLSLQRLPDGERQRLQQAPVRLKPGEVHKAEFAVKPASEGTFLVWGSVIRDGKEVMDFVKPLTVGAASGPVRIPPKEERIGRASERFEDRVALSGGGPADMELSTEIESPHVKWARPYSEGKLKVLVLTSCITGREAVELAQRLDMEIAWVTAGTQSELSSFSWVFGLGKKFTYTVERMNENIKQALSRPCDAIIIGGLDGSLFTEDTVRLFREKVSEGVGLVYVAPNRGRDDLYDLLPVEKETRLRDRNGTWAEGKPHFITNGIPFDALPPTDYSRYKAKGEILATVGGQPLVVVRDGPGKGRVAVLSYNTSWQGSGSYSSGITPWIDNKDCRFKYWEYHFSLLAKALVWSAGKESPVRLGSIAAEPKPAGAELVMTLVNTGAACKATAKLVLADRYGVVEHGADHDLAISAGSSTVRLPLTGSFPLGLHLADVIIADAAGTVLTWGSAALRLPEDLRIRKLSLDKRTYYPGDVAHAEVEIAAEGELPADAVVRAELIDRLGRLVVRQERTLPTPGPVSFDLPVGDPLVTSATLRVTVLVQGSPRSVAQEELITFPKHFAEREWGDWESCIWGSPGGAYRREYLLPVYARLYRDYGVSTCLASANWLNPAEFEWPVREGFRIMPMNVSFGAISVGHRVPKGKMTFSEQKLNYQKTQDKQYLIRPVCLNSPEDLEPLAQKLSKVAEYAGWLEPIGYNLGDEMSTTHYVTPYDYDFHPDALDAFRQWLSGEYADVAALNAEWETAFASWDEVLPMTAHEVKDRGNYAPWADHREFMDVAFAGFFDWTRERLREKDAGAGVGMSGSQAAEAYGGYDWSRLARSLDFIQNYTHHNTPIMQRSFAPGLPRAPWYGYTMRNPAARRTLWWRLFSGNYGGSYWSATFMFRPDLLPSAMTVDMAPVVREMQGGIAKLLRNCTRHSDIAVHYSHASIRAAFISQQAALFRENRGGWVNCLEDLGYQCEFVATPDLESGVLAERKVAAFILPYSVALSEAEASALRTYVQGGGLLIADAKTGLMDEHCKTLAKGRLTDLFGIARPTPDPLCAARDGEARLAGELGACKPAGLTLDAGLAEPALERAGATAALGSHGDTPVAIVNRVGSGHAVFLNLFLDTYGQRRKLGVEAPLRELCANLLRLQGIAPPVEIKVEAKPAPHTFTVRYTQGEALYVGTVLETGDKGADWGTNVTIALPASGFRYDVRKGRALGKGDSVSTNLLAGDAALLAVLPYEVTGVAVGSAGGGLRRGRPVRYGLTVGTAGGQAGMHVLRTEVLDPGGEVRAHYGTHVATRDGEAVGEFVPALNDPPGRWTIRATDLVSGKTGTASVEVGE